MPSTEDAIADNLKKIFTEFLSNANGDVRPLTDKEWRRMDELDKELAQAIEDGIFPFYALGEIQRILNSAINK